MGINDRLLAHWKFNGDCRDSSGNGNHGANRGVPISSAAGRDGTCLWRRAGFDGRAAQR